MQTIQRNRQRESILFFKKKKHDSVHKILEKDKKFNEGD